MKLIKFTNSAVSLFLSSLLLTSGNYNIYAETTETSDEDTPETFIVTFLDFDGNIMNTQELKSGESIDYSLPDVDSLKVNLNPFTQRMFSAWDISPETVTEDTVIQALYAEAVISLDSFPEKTSYYLSETEIDSKGLSVVITITTQTTDFDENGERIVTVEETDISSSCTFSPSNPSEALANSDTAEINIYPISSNVAVGSYTIGIDILKGDVNFDGFINASDSSTVLAYYASLSSGGEDTFSERTKQAAEMNDDGIINASDASEILKIYADISS